MIKNKIENWLLRHLTKTVVPEDILLVDKGTSVVYLGGIKMSDTETKNLREEAMFISKTRLWSILTSTLRAEAQEVMFNKSKDFEDMRSGKLMLYCIDVQDKIINKLIK